MRLLKRRLALSLIKACETLERDACGHRDGNTWIMRWVHGAVFPCLIYMSVTYMGMSCFTFLNQKYNNITTVFIFWPVSFISTVIFGTPVFAWFAIISPSMLVRMKFSFTCLIWLLCYIFMSYQKFFFLLSGIFQVFSFTSCVHFEE